MTEYRHARHHSTPQAVLDPQRRSRRASFLPPSPPPESTSTSKSSDKQPLRSILKKPKPSSPPKTQLITYPDHEEHRNHRGRSKSQPPPMERVNFTSDALTRRPSRPPAPEPPRYNSRSPSPAPSTSSTLVPQLSVAGSSEVDFHMGPYNPNPPRESKKTKHRSAAKPLYTYGHGYPATEKCKCGHYNHKPATPTYYYTVVPAPTSEEKRPKGHRTGLGAHSYRRPAEPLAYTHAYRV